MRNEISRFSKLITQLTIVLIFSLSASAQSTQSVIFDTDICGDHDDVAAAAMLNSLATSGEAEILAMAVAETGEGAVWGAPCLDAINTFYGHPDIPIGVPSYGFEYNDIVYSRQIASEFPYELDTVWDATVLYRKVLSGQPDTSVVIITVGYMTNIANLLQSGADQYSDLDGVELVNRKVKKWVCMGGRFPEGGPETNATSDAPASKYAIDNWPRPILFSGYEIGAKINSGKRLPYIDGQNPVKRAFEIASCLGCCNTSFDQTAVLAAVRDPNLYWDIVSEGYASMSANPEIGNIWHSSPDKNHAYLLEKVPASQIEDIIENLMMDLPNAEKQAFFTLPFDNTITLIQGAEFEYRLPYYQYSNGEVNIRYENLPAWIFFEDDMIYGVAPHISANISAQFKAILLENNSPGDTVDVKLSVVAEAPLIVDLNAASGASGSFSMESLKPGDRVFPDRSVTLQSIPNHYNGCTWIRCPANDAHRLDLGDEFITFIANEDITVFIGYDRDYLELLPDWLKKWTDTEDEIELCNSSLFRMYKREFSKGKVILGNSTTIEEPLRPMYLILVQQQSGFVTQTNNLKANGN